MTEPLDLKPHFNNTPEKKDPASSKTTVAAAPSKLTVADAQQANLAIEAVAKSENAIDRKTLHLANVPSHVGKGDLEKLFTKYGAIRRIHIVQRPSEKRSFAFISFRTESSARQALSAIRDSTFFGMTEPFKAEFSKHEAKKTTTAATTMKEKADGKLAATPKAAESALPVVDKAGASGSEKTTSSKKSKSGRTTVFVKEVAATDDEAKLMGVFSAVGPVKNIYILDNEASQSRQSVVVFEKAEHASKAVKEKTGNAVFPRQRYV
jgi:RNA recognition motif-containing protein